MKDLFLYLKDDEELSLIKGCVFYYEMEFIHPFLDGNGRMGRLWQRVILKEKYQVFGALYLETLISQTQKNFYEALSLSDKAGKSTAFIEYMLQIIDQAPSTLLNINGKTISVENRIAYFFHWEKRTLPVKNIWMCSRLFHSYS